MILMILKRFHFKIVTQIIIYCPQKKKKLIIIILRSDHRPCII